MFGKIQQFGHRALGLAKGGLATAQHYYQKGLHLAGEMGHSWNHMKQIGSILAPFIDQRLGLSLIHI